MTTSELSENLRHHVKRAVTHYAKFYAELVGNNPELAEQELSAISEIDRSLKSQEDNPSFNAYFERRTQLMRIFHFQLMKTMEGQVQQEVLDQAEKLLDKLEVIKLDENT